jgi:hypothetical protein
MRLSCRRDDRRRAVVIDYNNHGTAMNTSVLISLLAGAAALQAQTLTQVVAFDYNDFNPVLVVQGRDGIFISRAHPVTF